ncbi:hypothetical protein [Maridesulfovibrio ferrireducens]|uniref:hypothetical protein n=1 Tax=Maridesulfovibrio ferrireducens TaxID=246191 RepID=UPI001A20EFCB|nr:hypothetical protein [Maridesulfovibrio ferrireducens]MBI9110301.1 hypothetical protein [Maridesulfovibrio ferrireducens]
MSWQEFAERPHSVKIYTVEISVADPANPTAEREVLRFSSDSIDPALTDHIYEPCIKTLPIFTRSLQSLTYGRTAATFGNMVLLIDEVLREKIANRLFAGAPVVIRSGFDGLPVSDFKDVFTGRVSGSPNWDDLKITLPLADGVLDLLDHKLTEQTLSGLLPTVISGLLDSAKLTADKRDSAMWDKWVAENNFSIWLPVSANQTLGSVLDIILSPLACWYGFDRSGKFRIATFSAPAIDAVPALELTDIELTKFSEKNHGNQASKVVVSYYSVTGELPETAERSWEDSAIKELNPSAVEMSKNTVLSTVANADAVRDRWKDLFSGRRFVADISAKTQLFALNIGDYVRVIRDRLNIDYVYQVQQISDDMGNNKVSVGLFR